MILLLRNIFFGGSSDPRSLENHNGIKSPGGGGGGTGGPKTPRYDIESEKKKLLKILIFDDFRAIFSI